MLNIHLNLWKFKIFFHQEKFYHHLLFLFKKYKNNDKKIISIFTLYEKKLHQYFDYNTYMLFLEFSIFYKKFDLAKIVLDDNNFFYQGKGLEYQKKNQTTLFLQDLYLKNHPLWIILNCSHSFEQLLNFKDQTSQYSYEYLLEFSQYIIKKLSILSFISKENIYKIYDYCHPNQKILLNNLLLDIQLNTKKVSTKINKI